MEPAGRDNAYRAGPEGQGPPLISSLSLDSVRYLGLTTTDSALELFDNALDAGALHVYMHILERSGKITLVIEDDGRGIPSEKVAQVLAFGGRVDQGGVVPIGKFGWGLPSAACCQTLHTDLYSKQKGGEWFHSYIDLPSMMGKPEARLPKEIQKQPPEELPLKLRNSESGTVVVLRDCDKLQFKNREKLRQALAQSAGETYRKYLDAGREIWIDGVRVMKVDPLMLMREHYIHRVAGYGKDFVTIPPITFEKIKDPATGMPAQVQIRVSLLDHDHIMKQPDPKAAAEEANINTDGQGFYLMRHDRQIGAGLSLSLFRRHNDFNYFRAEITFPPALDQLFGVQTNKNRFSLDASLRDQLDERLKGILPQLRRISKEWQAKDAKTSRTPGLTKSEEAAAKGESLLKPSTYPVDPKKVAEVKLEAEKRQAEEVRKVEQNPALSPEVKQKEIERIKNEFQFVRRPWKRVIAHSESGDFYVLRPHGDETEVVINTAHPFYKKVYEKAVLSGLDNQLDLLIFALAKAEYQAYANEKFVKFYDLQRKEWSTILSVYLGEFDEEEPES